MRSRTSDTRWARARLSTPRGKTARYRIGVYWNHKEKTAKFLFSKIFQKFNMEHMSIPNYVMTYKYVYIRPRGQKFVDKNLEMKILEFSL